MKIGFIGLGSMGRGMALNLAKAGHDVLAWNRSPLDAATLSPVTLVKTPLEALQAEVVFTMLSDDAAIRDVLLSPGILSGGRPGLIQVLTATISPEFAQELAEKHEALGFDYVAAPVFGTPDVAASGNLNIMVAGKQDAIARITPLLDILGKRTFVMGDRPAQANISKIAGNMMLTMAIEALAEGLAMTKGYGVQAEDFLGLMLQTQFACRAYENYGRRISEGNFDPGFKMSLGLKDLRLAVAAATSAGASTPMLSAVRERMGAAVDAGLGERDWSAMAHFTLSAGHDDEAG
jgi:3-hydroxyisobutyrate dehydrogenase-like beta-hydroxyacid dehydrogenase